VSLASIAFVPMAPLLIPEVAGGSAALDQELRAASLDVVARALASGPDEVVVVAAVPTPGSWTESSTWDFAGFGVARIPTDPRMRLPWPLGIGAWLLDECGWNGSRRYVGVDRSTAAEALPDERVRSIVVVGDGSARQSERAPGHLDERAERYDDAVADLLARGDVVGLSELDDALATDLMCGAPPAWRWIAALIDGEPVTDAELVTHAAPYGVGYFVALWSFA
jgi:hypothetical protein